MTKQLLIIIGILTLLNSYKQPESKNNKESEEKEIVEIKKDTTELNTVEESYIENDSLINAMESELENITLNPKFTIHKKPIQNKHVDNLMDTIIKRTLKKTEITSYKSADKEWVYKARI